MVQAIQAGHYCMGFHHQQPIWHKCTPNEHCDNIMAMIFPEIKHKVEDEIDLAAIIAVVSVLSNLRHCHQLNPVAEWDNPQ